MSVRVSVVIGVHNGEQRLEATLASVLSQTGVDFEVVIVDDGSTDATARILERIRSLDRRVRVLRQQQSGLTRALITGCTAAQGEYIARQDVGDVSLPGRLYDQVAALDGEQRLAFVGCGFDLVGPADELLVPGVVESPQRISNSLLESDARKLVGPHHGTVVFRTSAYEKVGGYRAAYAYAQDLDLWTRLIEVGDFGLVRKILYQVRFEEGSITAGKRHLQARYRRLVARSTQARRAGRDEGPCLAEAAGIGRGGKPAWYSRGAAAYFIGSCLQRRGDVRATGYLRAALSANPLHIKAWAKLARAVISR